MHTIEGTETSPRSRHPLSWLALSSAGRLLTARLEAWWSEMGERHRRRLTRRMLESLDDRTLHDIGVARGEISSIVAARCNDRRRPV